MAVIVIWRADVNLSVQPGLTSGSRGEVGGGGGICDVNNITSCLIYIGGVLSVSLSFPFHRKLVSPALKLSYCYERFCVFLCVIHTYAHIEIFYCLVQIFYCLVQIFSDVLTLIARLISIFTRLSTNEYSFIIYTMIQYVAYLFVFCHHQHVSFA